MRSWQKQSGRINVAIVAFLASLGALAALVAALAFSGGGPASSTAGGGSVKIYCAAALMQPVEQIIKQYEEETGEQIVPQTGPSQGLLSQIEVSGSGDLFLPADDSYLELARKKDLIAETIPLVQMKAVAVVAQGNPKKIATLDDLLRDDVRLVQANPDAAAIGKVTRETLKKTDRWAALEKHTIAMKGTVHDAANDVVIGQADASIIWDGMAAQYPKLATVEIPELADAKASVAVAVLRGSGKPTAALRFARYLAARDRGMVDLAKAGYKTVEGDAWSKTPELKLFGGSMLRPALEKTIEEFENREGVRVTRVYNGCGILVAQMKAGEQPDAYFSCDDSFLRQVNDRFLAPREFSHNRLVILVHKGNPKEIHSLKDLAKPGLRVGIGHEKQCAMGALTETTLKTAGLYGDVRKNVVVESPTGDLLVNQLRAGSLDAIVAYISNITASEAELEAIPIDIPCAIATQPYAVSKASDNKQLAARLLVAVDSAAGRERFTQNHFWLVADAATKAEATTATGAIAPAWEPRKPARDAKTPSTDSGK